MISEILKKIDEHISWLTNEINNCGHDGMRLREFDGRKSELEWVKEIVLAEQKAEEEEFQKVFSEVDAYKNELYPNGITIGDKIRESNESLSEYLYDFQDRVINSTTFKMHETILSEINQPYKAD